MTREQTMIAVAQQLGISHDRVTAGELLLSISLSLCPCVSQVPCGWYMSMYLSRFDNLTVAHSALYLQPGNLSNNATLYSSEHTKLNLKFSTRSRSPINWSRCTLSTCNKLAHSVCSCHPRSLSRRYHQSLRIRPQRVRKRTILPTLRAHVKPLLRQLRDTRRCPTLL